MKKFDLVFLLHRSATRALLCRLAGIPERIGHRTRKRAFLLTHSIIPPKKDEVHRIDYYLSIIQAAGIRVEDRFLDFFSSDEDAVFVSDFLKRNGVRGDDFVAVLNPGGNWLPKRWPKEYWAALADRLTKELGAKIVISGSAADQSLARHIQQAMLAKPVIACGALNLKQLAALAKRADLFITADTGPLHIANAVGSKQIIAIFGPTSPKITGPYPAKNVVVLHKEIGCAIPCYVAHCPDNRCMKAITPEDVVEKIREVKHETRNPKL
jgi:lipopolysaccharide heptosyltransferase II